ncbi:MAG: DmsC/YnfH family molybdoenzyme membrane anchor subunit [Raoultibacter sp.]
MESGFEAFSLSLFTTLSPAGTLGFITVAFAVLVLKPDEACTQRLNRLLALPLSCVLIGFIASATHLGTPANALHVFSGIGRSPLSNEVFAAICFLAAGGSYWMVMFKERFPATLAKIWLGVACIAGIGFIAMTSVAYSVFTVPTWNTIFVPANLVFSGLLAGPIIGMLTYTLADYQHNGYAVALTVLATIALVVGSLCLFAQNADLAHLANNEIIAATMVPHYRELIWAHVALGCLGIACTTFSLKHTLSKRKRIALRGGACLILCGAVFLTRIAFYHMHMTIGF